MTKVENGTDGHLRLALGDKLSAAQHSGILAATGACAGDAVVLLAGPDSTVVNMCKEDRYLPVHVVEASPLTFPVPIVARSNGQGAPTCSYCATRR